MSFSETIPPSPRWDLTEDRYATLRSGLSRCSYNEQAVLARVGAQEIPEIFEAGFLEGIPTEAEDGLDVLIHAFLLGRGIPRAAFEAKLGGEFVEACLVQGLLRDMVRQTRLFATVSIQPSLPESDGLWIVSDRVVPAPEALMPGGDGLVYPTVTPSAQTFLRFLPRRECGSFLEVCAGCGPAATLAAEFAMTVVASDIDARAVRFARYNARLNEAPSFRGVAASLYDDLHGAFDVIAAHPPYMPSDGPVEAFYGGGVDGTDLLRQLIAGLPGRLHPGGLFYAVAMIPEGHSFSAEARVRQWLGEGASQHDVYLFPLYERTLIEVAYEAAAKLGKGMEAASRYRRTLLAMGHSGFVYGALLVRRHQGEERPIEIRRKISERSSWRELLWCVDWETAIKDPTFAHSMLKSSVCATSELEVQVSHRAGREGLEPVSFRAIARYPFAMESEIQGWMAMLLGQAGEGRTGTAMMEGAKQAGLIHPETPPDEFARLLTMFVSGGFLECDLCPLPISRVRGEAE